MITYLNCRLEVEHYRSSDTVCDLVSKVLANSTAIEAVNAALSESLGDDFETAYFNGVEVETATSGMKERA